MMPRQRNNAHNMAGQLLLEGNTHRAVTRALNVHKSTNILWCLVRLPTALELTDRR